MAGVFDSLTGDRKTAESRDNLNLHQNTLKWVNLY